MRLTKKNIALSNRLRAVIQAETEVVSDGEGVAMMLLWGFLCDHARSMDMDVEQLSREQLEAFIDYARDNVFYAREH